MPDTRREYQDLFDVYWPIGVGVFLVVLALVVYVVLRFRSSGDEFPDGRDENKPAEIVYAVGLACVVALLLGLTYGTMDHLSRAASTGHPPVDVHVTAARWSWRFDYPRLSLTQAGTSNRPATLVVPADTPIRFRETSRDVVHSFWVPSVRFKRDAFPGRTTTFTLVFRDRGFHREAGECAEFCGLRHAYMTFHVNVLAPRAFERWVRARHAYGSSG
jgi:cytochrome c oxidase subunit II